jgi:2-oxoglutarate ferredoxin oxidoreductase subunit alpha
MDIGVIEALVGEQFKSKERLIKSNLDALHMGRDYVRDHLKPLGLKMKTVQKVGDQIFIDGNTAAAIGAVYGGATVCAWYPITPSTSLAEAFTEYCEKLRLDPETGKARYAIVQAEDEIASIGMVVGAGWNGARAFTCTSGPGVSLMQEFVGLSYFAEIPAVIFDVQRGGPSTGMPTRTQQADLIGAAYASHGDTKHPMLFPEDPRECFEMGALAFDLADRLQTTIFVMLDLDIGMNEWLCKPLAWDPDRRIDRGKVMTKDELEAGRDFGRYLDVDGDGIPYRTYPGTHPTRGGYFTRGTSRNPYARYSEEGSVYVDNMERLLRKFDTAKALIPAPVRRDAKHASRTGVIYFGSTTPSMNEALEALESQGRQLNALRVRGFPFADAVYEFIAEHDEVFVVEQNRDGQLRTLLINEGDVDPAKLIAVLHYDGTPITARFITGEIAARMDAAVPAIEAAE